MRRDSLVRQTSTTQGSVDPRLLGVTPEEFEDWFMSKDGFNGSLRRELAKDIWKQAEARAEQEIKERRHRMGLFTTANAEVHWIGLQPSWAQLRDAIDGAPMPTSDHPNWFVHFYVCLIRYLLKLLRTRVAFCRRVPFPTRDHIRRGAQPRLASRRGMARAVVACALRIVGGAHH